MTLRPDTKAILVALIASGLAMSSAFATARGLRRAAFRESHQIRTIEELFESSSPRSPTLIASGRKLFLNNCAHCHGADARGDEGPDLHDVQVSDRYIANIVTRGIPHEMPSFGKKLSRGDISALTAYIRSLETGRGDREAPIVIDRMNHPKSLSQKDETL